jgi:hypothetical protein
LNSVCKLRVALAPFLKDCAYVTTLGIRPGLADYQPWERDLLSRAERIYFPTRRFVHVLDAGGKNTFPSAASYRYRASRLLQLSLLGYLDLPAPRTRIYYGHRQKRLILQHFNLPLLAMRLFVSPQSEWVVSTEAELRSLIGCFNPIIIQEIPPLVRRIRFVCVSYQCLVALESHGNEAWNGPGVPVDPQSPELCSILGATLRLLRAGHLDDMVVEWGYGREGWWVMKLSMPPARMATLSGVVGRHQYVAKLIAEGFL